MYKQIAYGTTENSPVTFLGFPQDSEDLKINTVGCIMNHTEVRILPSLTQPLSTVNIYMTTLWFTV